MTENRQSNKTGPASPLDWMSTFTEFWSPFFNAMRWDGPPGESAAPFQSQGRLDEGLQSTIKLWQVMVKSMASPAALETFQSAAQTTPEILLHFTQTCLTSFMRFQTEAADMVAKTGKPVSPHEFQELDKELLHRWTDIYQKEFSQYLNMPQIGLGRFYQEKALQAIDKSNLFQAAVSEFLHVLYLPIEKSFKIVQQKISEMADTGELEDNPKVYYRMWIQILEGCYMELFKQPEFPEALRKTLQALNEFSRSRQAVINDLLRSLSVPTQDDLDELYKEIHVLKKRLRNDAKNKM
jgi:class III poly(R)-hydroxyalkanoic acid synthase PhaE subunit